MPTRSAGTLNAIIAVTIMLGLGALASTACADADPTPVIKSIAAAGRLSDLRWPDFPDYRSQFGAFYQSLGYRLAWSKDGQASAQAKSAIGVLRDASSKGLDPEDYDASRWDQRLQELGAPDAAARFDAALTVCVMRYASDLHIGRLNPQHLHAGLTEKTPSFDLAQLLRDRLINAQDVRTELDAVEPQYAGYKRTEAALQRYMELARQDVGEPLPTPPRTLDPAVTTPGPPASQRCCGYSATCRPAQRFPRTMSIRRPWSTR